IELFERRNFSISISPAGLKIYSIEVSVDNQLVYSQTNNSGMFSFSLDPRDYADGRRTLKVVSKRSSGTKSLADLLGNELVSAETKWNLIIDNQPPAQIVNSKVEIIDGRSIVSWPQPNKNNFVEYNIVRSYFIGNGQEIIDTLKVKDRKLTSFHDASYVGGKVAYSVDIKGYRFYVKGVKTFFDCVPLSIEFKPNISNPSISYPRSILYNNSIEIAWTGSFSYSSYLVTPISYPGKIDLNVKFGESSEFNVFVKPINKDYNATGNFRISGVGYLGLKMKEYFTNVLYSNSTKSYLFGSYNGAKIPANIWLFKLDQKTLRPLDSLRVPFGDIVMSEDGIVTYLVTRKRLLKL
ncbi:MAG: hypothetical protein ACKO13_10245, partial [Cytophagales bacterium]